MDDNKIWFVSSGKKSDDAYCKQTKIYSTHKDLSLESIPVKLVFNRLRVKILISLFKFPNTENSLTVQERGIVNGEMDYHGS